MQHMVGSQEVPMMGVYVEGLTGFQCNRFLIHLSDMTTDIVASGNGNKMPSSRGVGRLTRLGKARVEWVLRGY